MATLSEGKAEHREAVFEAFATATGNSIDRALSALSLRPSTTTTTTTTTIADTEPFVDSVSSKDQQLQETRFMEDKLQNLFELQQTLQTLLQEKIATTKRQRRDLCIAHSPLLQLSQELLGQVAGFLDEGGLWAMERSIGTLLETGTNDGTPGWSVKQWNVLDKKRTSKSSLPTNQYTSRDRGIQLARASTVAEKWEAKARESSKNGLSSEGTLVLHGDEEDDDYSTTGLYIQDFFVQDFGAFFRNPRETGTPNLEFFIRLTYNDANQNTILLLEGFQSNFQSLRHIADVEDDGHHSYIGVSEDRHQVVMVRNHPREIRGLVRQHMGLDERYIGIDDDSDLELDDEDEFHFLQWPEAGRKSFLDRVTITIVRCRLGTNDHDDDYDDPATAIVGSTTGYDGSNQHFAMFRPLELYPRGVSRLDHIARYLPTPVVNIGIGCGVGESLHIVVKWEEQDFWL